jgi:ArsR family transcriptional regulator
MAALNNLRTSNTLFRAFADPTRLRILNLLRKSESCVCHLTQVLRLPQSTVSRHLAYLRRAGLVETWEEGTWNHYRLSQPGNALHRALVDCVGSCLGNIEQLRRDLQQAKQLKGSDG